MKYWKVIYNMAGFQFEEIFDDYQDAKYFAEDRAQVGFQYIIVQA
jgi:hypothetical protein